MKDGAAHVEGQSPEKSFFRRVHVLVSLLYFALVSIILYISPAGLFLTRKIANLSQLLGILDGRRIVLYSNVSKF